MFLGSNTHFFTWRVYFPYQGWWQISYGIYSERKNGNVPQKMAIWPLKHPKNALFSNYSGLGSNTHLLIWKVHLFYLIDSKSDNKFIQEQKSVYPSWKNGHLTQTTLKIMFLGSNTPFLTWKVQFLYQGWWQISYGIYSKRRTGNVPPKNGYLTPKTL